MPRGLLPVTLELRGVRDVDPDQAEHDADAIIAALREGGYIVAEETLISAEVAAPVIGGDELALVTANADDIAGMAESSAAASALEAVDMPEEVSVIKQRHTEGAAAVSPALKHPATPLAGCEYIYSPVSGLILHRKKLGAHIRPGEVIAEVVDPITDSVTPLVAEHGGVLYARHWAKFATAGMLVVRLAGDKEIRSGDLLVG